MNKLVFLFFISLAVVPSLLNADTIFFKDGMRLDVEKTWEENNQIKYILYGSTISVAMEKVERIEKSKEDKPAQQRLKASKELQSTFDSSILKGWELKFVVRGNNCDVLHVEGYTNLEEEMMKSLAYGTVIYGKILPGGVNNFAFNHGFRDVVYSNSGNSKYVTFGPAKLTRKQVRVMKACTDQMASQVKGEFSTPPTPSPTPQFEQLAWSTAKPGTKLYDGSYKHEATIVSVDRAGGIIVVKFVQSGSKEPKKLSAVAAYWYVKK